MKRFFMLSLLVLLLLCTSCNLFQENFTFVNASSYVVHVQPNGQLWLEFYLAPGQSTEVENHGDYDAIRYLYSPSNNVYPADSYNKVTFYNR